MNPNYKNLVAVPLIGAVLISCIVSIAILINVMLTFHQLLDWLGI